MTDDRPGVALPVERDLTLIFERDDVADAIAGHCAKTHSDDQARRACPYCQRLRLMLANAITEWLALVDQDRAARVATHSEPS